MTRLKFMFGAFAISACAFAFTSCSTKQHHVDIGELKTIEDSASYVLGLSQGMGMKAQGMELNPEIFVRAYQQGYAGDTAGVMNQEQMQEVMQKYQDKMMQKQQAQAKQNAIPFRQAAEKFLAENKSKEGVITTASGLQYKIIKEGKGVKPTIADDRVRIQYSLRLLDKDGKIGAPIEDTFERGQEPVIFSLHNLIPGMKEGLMMMNGGAVYDFWIHPDLGYGDQDNAMLPAGSMLVFHVEMVEVVPAKK